MGDSREAARFVVVLNHEDITFDHQRPMLLEDANRLLGITHHHPHHGVIRRVGNRESENVDLGSGQGITDHGEGSRLVLQKDCQLLDDFRSKLVSLDGHNLNPSAVPKCINT